MAVPSRAFAATPRLRETPPAVDIASTVCRGAAVDRSASLSATSGCVTGRRWTGVGPLRWGESTLARRAEHIGSFNARWGWSHRCEGVHNRPCFGLFEAKDPGFGGLEIRGRDGCEHASAGDDEYQTAEPRSLFGGGPYAGAGGGFEADDGVP